MTESKLKDRCPACGVPRQMFEPYTDPVSIARRRVLNFDLHPIAVHFPISFTVAVLVLSIASIFFGGPVQGFIISTTKVMSLFLPLLVLLAFAVGLIDGRIRFRRFKNSQILKKKILYGLLFLVFAVGLTISVWLGGFSTILLNCVAIVLSAASLACVVMLSLLGTQIINAAFPG
jgi:uncharacterized membrane protein